MKFNRRDTLILAAAASALSLCGVAAASAAEGDMVDVAKLMAPAGGVADHVQGSETAPVTVIEYASPTCPHCAAFSNTVLPALLGPDRTYYADFTTIYDAITGERRPAEEGARYDFVSIYAGDDPAKYGLRPEARVDIGDNDQVEVYRGR